MLRTIRSPYALNEVLVAGEKVAGLKRLREERFEHRLDRSYWQELSQRKL